MATKAATQAPTPPSSSPRALPGAVDKTGWGPLVIYAQDFWQRSTIFLDILRQSGNQQAEITRLRERLTEGGPLEAARPSPNLHQRGHEPVGCLLLRGAATLAGGTPSHNACAFQGRCAPTVDRSGRRRGCGDCGPAPTGTAKRRRAARPYGDDQGNRNGRGSPRQGGAKPVGGNPAAAASRAGETPSQDQESRGNTKKTIGPAGIATKSPLLGPTGELSGCVDPRPRLAGLVLVCGADQTKTSV
jgi:hypothetical protein